MNGKNSWFFLGGGVKAKSSISGTWQINVKNIIVSKQHTIECD